MWYKPRVWYLHILVEVGSFEANSSSTQGHIGSVCLIHLLFLSFSLNLICHMSILASRDD